mgnify:CR=1 FL=1
MITFITGKQISPCIAAKARFALYPNCTKPTNIKRCSQTYWEKVIDTLCENDPKLNLKKESAKVMYNQLIPTK